MGGAVSQRIRDERKEKRKKPLGGKSKDSIIPSINPLNCPLTVGPYSHNLKR